LLGMPDLSDPWPNMSLLADILLGMPDLSDPWPNMSLLADILLGMPDLSDPWPDLLVILHADFKSCLNTALGLATPAIPMLESLIRSCNFFRD
jgi:hypothetical protein